MGTSRVQQLNALQRANRQRTAMREALAGVRRGDDPTELLQRDDLPITLERFLAAIPTMGRVNTIAVLKEVHRKSGHYLTGWHMLGGATRNAAVLTPGQRAALAGALARRATEYEDRRARYARAKARKVAA